MPSYTIIYGLAVSIDKKLSSSAAWNESSVEENELPVAGNGRSVPRHEPHIQQSESSAPRNESSDLRNRSPTPGSESFTDILDFSNSRRLPSGFQSLTSPRIKLARHEGHEVYEVF